MLLPLSLQSERSLRASGYLVLRVCLLASALLPSFWYYLYQCNVSTSTAILAHPRAYGNPTKAEVFAKPDARQWALIANLGPLAGLLEDPGLRDLQAFGKLFRG